MLGFIGFIPQEIFVNSFGTYIALFNIGYSINVREFLFSYT